MKKCVTFHFLDLMRLERVVPELNTHSKAEHPMTWDSYHPIEDINAYLTYLDGKYSDLVRIY